MNAIINCPDTYACDIICGATSACRGAALNCGSGTCDLECQGNGYCRDATLTCGAEECTATCTGSQTPTVVCGSSCNCVNGC
jgi:hypothetical protein